MSTTNKKIINFQNMEQASEFVKEHNFTTESKEKLLQILRYDIKQEKLLAAEARGDLTKWRNDLINWRQEKYSNTYDSLFSKTMELIRTIQEQGEETDRSIKIGGLELDKKMFFVDSNHENNNNEDIDIFDDAREDYAGGKKFGVAIRQRVLNDKENSMHNVVQEAIAQREKEGYRPATVADFEMLFTLLPGNTKEEKLIALQLVTGWFGRGILGVETGGNIIFRLDRGSFRSCIGNGPDTDPRSYGSIFFVKDHTSKK